MKHRISVVMPVHAGIKPEYFTEATQSILNQSLKVFEIIIVVDGGVSKELLNKIENFSLYNSILVIYLDENCGPGFARDVAIKSSNGDIIALMDADDISRNNRFEVQVNAFIANKNDMLGGYISEFHKKVGDFDSIRKVPTSMSEIKKNMVKRMPFNNVTLMFTKELYLKSGGYKNLRHVEDYDLNFRMFLSAKSVLNLSQILVDVRIESNNSIFQRRVGMSYFIEEAKLFYFMKKSGYMRISDYLYSISSRCLIRLGPTWLARYIYIKFRS
jgi:glycosyltransferase involved in cell wall biosynthesis